MIVNVKSALNTSHCCHNDSIIIVSHICLEECSYHKKYSSDDMDPAS